MSTTDRSWMYQRLDERGYISPVYINALKTFIEFACSKPSFMDGNLIKCPCKKKCKNRAYQEVDTARFHLLKFGFVPNYFLWDRHGETLKDREKQVNDNLAEVADDNHKVVEGYETRKRKVDELEGSYGNSIDPNNSSETFTSPQINDSLETKIQKLEKIAYLQQILIKKQSERIDKQHVIMEEVFVIIQSMREMVKVRSEKLVD